MFTDARLRYFKEFETKKEFDKALKKSKGENREMAVKSFTRRKTGASGQKTKPDAHGSAV